MGLELGQALGRLGSRVTLVEVTERLLPDAEPEIGETLAELLAGEGIELMTGARIERAQPRPGGGPRLTVQHEGRTRELDGDAILLGAGRGPAVESLRLEAAGVDGGPKGIPVDARLAPPRTATSPPATCSARRSAPSRRRRAAWGARPWTTRWTSTPTTSAATTARGRSSPIPSTSAIGLTEAQAREAGHDVGVATSGFSGGKARAWGQERGTVKAVVDRSTRRILGAHVLAYHAADLIHPVAVAMEAGSADPLLSAIHIHPTLGERVQGAVRSALA